MGIVRPSMKSVAGSIVRHRWAFVLVWLVLLAVCVTLAPRFMDVTSGGGFDLPHSESWQASSTLQNEFSQSYGHTVQLLFHNSSGQVSDPEMREQVEGLTDRTMELPGAMKSVTWYDSGLPNLVSPDGTSTYTLITFSGSEEEVQKYVPVIRGLADDMEGAKVYVLGGPAFDYDLEKTSEEDLRTAETYGLPVVAIILVLVFGSLVAAGLPVLLGGVSVTVTLASLFLLGHHMALSVFVLNMVTMLGLGLGIDYSLFMVSRFREELSGGNSINAAVASTFSTAGRAVVFSGAAVMVGMSMLVLFDIVFMRSMGVGGVLVSAVSVLVALTLLPAVLVIAKGRIDTLRVVPARFLRGGHGRFWHGLSRAVMRRPLLFLGISMGLLLVLALPVKDMKAGSPGAGDLSPESGSRLGIELLAEKWSPGEVSPIYIVFDTGNSYGVLDNGFRGGLTDLGRQLMDDGRVERVESIAGMDLPGGPGELRTWALENPEIAAVAASLVNIDGGGGKTVMRVIPVVPGSRETRQLVDELRREIIPAVGGLSGAEATVGGSAAEIVDFTDMLKDAFPFLVGAVLLITYIVLLLLFRSLVIPLKAIFMNLLSVAAAYGVLVMIFQKGWGDSLLGIDAPGGILPFVPVILFSILFGLSMDYEVFMLSRIKEEYDRSGDNEQAVALGLEKTGRIITAAALIMIVVFGSFALTRSIVVKEIGLGLAVSIFLDATIVRIIMVPATMKLLGKWNWWLPAWLDRLLPDFSLKH